MYVYDKVRVFLAVNHSIIVWIGRDTVGGELLLQ